MATAPPPSLAERLRSQIARMVQGNGIAPESVVAQDEQSVRVALLGQLDVRLTCKTKTTQGNGDRHGRWLTTYQNFSELNGTLAALQSQSVKDAESLAYAADQILLEPNEAWGLQAQNMPIHHLDFDVGATETCQQCKGEKISTCQTCNGQRRHECEQCHGKRQMPCTGCFGRGVTSSGEDCLECRRQGTVNCTFCQGQGEVSCRVCNGRGQIPCQPCDATGKQWQQVTFEILAQTSFRMATAEDYPEHILRHVRRLQPEHLVDGRADIQIKEKQTIDAMRRVTYEATFPITQLQFGIGNLPARFVMMGEKSTMIESARFMDQILAPSLDLLRRARERNVPAPAALAELAKIRFYRDAMSPGKNGRDLRRKYPFGISAGVLREAPAALQYLLSILTEQPRMLAAVGFNAALGMVVLYLYHVGKTDHAGIQFQDIAILVAALLVNFATLLATHFGLTKKTMESFGLKANFSNVSFRSALGKTGLASLCVTAVLCLLAWVMQ